jgi:hypothetical protein
MCIFERGWMSVLGRSAVVQGRDKPARTPGDTATQAIVCVEIVERPATPVQEQCNRENARSGAI